MDTQTLQAEVRAERGKGPARQLRAKGLIPGVCYGPEQKEPLPVQVSPKELRRALATPWGRNTVIKMQLSGRDQLVMVRELQVHPISREPEHVDFYTLSEARAITVDVPLTTEGKAPGVLLGGRLIMVFRHLPITAMPGQIPVSVSVDISDLGIGDGVQAKDVKLPAGCAVALSANTTVVSVQGEKPEEEEAAAVAAPGEAAAPAAAGGSTAPAAPPAADAAAKAPAKKEKGK